MYETTSVPVAFGKLNLPSKSVIVPFVVPFITILAPIIGSPFASVTIPSTAFACCAHCALPVPAKADNGPPAIKADAIKAENNILLGEILILFSINQILN